MRISIKSIMPFVCGLALAGCGVFSKDDNSNKSDGGDGVTNMLNRGCIQGVILDGLTGQRVPVEMKNADGKNQGVHVLVRNKLMQAEMVEKHYGVDSVDKNLSGEYYLCGFPLDEKFPMFVWVDGYEKFESVIEVSSTISQKTPNSEVQDIVRTHPTMLANVKLYPVGTETQDVKFTVTHKGKNLAGAKVQLKSTGSNMLDETRTILPQVRLVPQSQTTDANGSVLFSKDALVLGGKYEYTVIPPNGGSEVRVQTGRFNVGLRAPGAPLTDSPYQVFVDMADTAKTPEVIASSLDASDVQADGVIELTFDQPVELAPASQKAKSAELAGAVNAQLAEGEGKSVSVKIAGNKVTLTPVWKVLANAGQEPNLTVIYKGLTFRAVGDVRMDLYYSLTEQQATVRLWDVQ